ncbi:hemerythrin domain-containing protein [Pontibacter cellulosilyticus]|uniref:Hemerythrin domain-containing protein n=1 Tax=Pontibacter cellulosilyticus TaxID=1720253 RepID=A0A923SK28_9BACT|nr:hemerythrin domain-containing protein [Pontibacter cellulosilyticus]MBC5994509.1 hemerythrin domain-containing protein [Pontibacter cellulosilyticus]
MEKAINPQKRDKSLVPLSKEHHFGLLFCWKIREGLKNGADLQTMRNYVCYFWNNILKEHCEEEEWLLKRLLPANDSAQIRLQEEHRLLQEIIEIVCAGKQHGLAEDLFQTLQQDLVDHIRWEERELFPYLQAVVNPDELELTGKLLEHKHFEKKDKFTPEFWVRTA